MAFFQRAPELGDHPSHKRLTLKGWREVKTTRAQKLREENNSKRRKGSPVSKSTVKVLRHKEGTTDPGQQRPWKPEEVRMAWKVTKGHVESRKPSSRVGEEGSQWCRE